MSDKDAVATLSGRAALAYDWLAPKLSTQERLELDVIVHESSAQAARIAELEAELSIVSGALNLAAMDYPKRIAALEQQLAQQLLALQAANSGNVLLQEALTAANSKIAALTEMNDNLRADYDKMRADRDRLQEDAGRYRHWLLGIGAVKHGDDQQFTHQPVFPLPGANLMKGSAAEHFTNAIDAARKGKS